MVHNKLFKVKTTLSKALSSRKHKRPMFTSIEEGTEDSNTAAVAVTSQCYGASLERHTRLPFNLVHIVVWCIVIHA